VLSVSPAAEPDLIGEYTQGLAARSGSAVEVEAVWMLAAELVQNDPIADAIHALEETVATMASTPVTSAPPGDGAQVLQPLCSRDGEMGLRDLLPARHVTFEGGFGRREAIRSDSRVGTVG
jgi:hypothetical protein